MENEGSKIPSFFLYGNIYICSMDRGIYKFHIRNKFALGVWVRYNGGINPNEFLFNVLNTIKNTDDLSVNLYKTFKQIEAENNLTKYSIWWNKRTPFKIQMNAEVDVLFWFEKLSKEKLKNELIFGKYEYIVNCGNKGLSVKVKYEDRQNKFSSSYDQINDLIFNIQSWVKSIDNELADCDCFEKNNLTL